MAQLNGNIRGILQNTIDLLPFDVETAKLAVPTIASQVFKNLTPITFESTAIEKLVSHFAVSGGIVIPGLLRNAVLWLRQWAANNAIDNITVETLDNSKLFELSYLDEALALIADNNRRESMIAFMNGEMIVAGETQPLPAYKGIACGKYGLDANDLDLMVSHYVLREKISDDGRMYYLPFSSEILRAIKDRCTEATPAVVSTSKTPKIQSAVATIPVERKKTGKSRILVYAFAMATLVSIAFVMLAFSLKGDAERNANIAKSNMLSSFAFQKLEGDPTFSLRLAQQAVKMDTNNVQAYSALLNSFYNTDIFYNISAQVQGDVVKAEVSDDASYILAYIKNEATSQYAARILDIDGKIVAEMQHPKEVTSISVSHDGRRIITTSYDSIARIYDITGRLLSSINGHKAILWAADCSPDGKYYLTAGSDCRVVVWDSVGNCAATLKGHDFDVYCARFSPDGKYVLSSGGDNTARLWTRDGSNCKVLEIKEDVRFSMSLVNGACFSPDGKYILLAANDYLNKNHKARLWDLEGNELMTFSGHGDWINSARFSSDSRHIITSCRDKVVRVFSIGGKEEKVLKGHNSNVWSASFLPDNQTIVSVGDDHTVRTWSIGRRFETYERAINVGFAGFSPDGLKLMVVQDSVAQAWDLTGEVVASFAGHKSVVNTARFSPDGRYVLTASKDGTARLWKSDGSLVEIFGEHSDAVNDAVFSADGNYAVTISNDSTIVIHNLVSHEANVVREHRGSVTAVGFSPDGNLFATGGLDGKVMIHDVSGKTIRVFHGHSGRVNSVCFSPCGKMLISTSSDETAVLWDNIGQMLFTFRGYENKVNSAVFSPNCKYIVTTSDDGSARLWTADGIDIMNFRHDGAVSDAVFSPDGKYLLTVFRNSSGLRTLKLRMLNPDDITRHIDQLDLYGSVWQPDAETMKKYGID
jgi:WD40 repeat protein